MGVFGALGRFFVIWVSISELLTKGNKNITKGNKSNKGNKTLVE